MAASDLQPGTTKPVITLTGAGGFIGRHIQQALLSAGFDLIALVRPNSRNGPHIDPRCEVVETNLDNPRVLDRVLQRTTAVIYGAGAVRGRELADFEPANVHGIKHVMQALAQLEEPPPILFISSLAASKPGLSNYAQSKFSGEVTVAQFDQIPWCIIRPPAIYGPGDKEMRPLLDWARRGLVPIVGPRNQRVSLLHVSDLVQAIVAWVRHPEACAKKTFTIHDGKPGGYDWPTIAAAGGSRDPRLLVIPPFVLRGLARANWILSGWFGYAPMLTPGKTRELQEEEWICDNAAFHAATQWEPQVDLKEGVRRLYNDPSSQAA